MMLYKVVMAVFIFGAVISGINDSGIFAYKLPETSLNTPGQAEVRELTNSTGNVENPLALASATITFLKALSGGLLAVFTILPMLLAFGCPAWLAGIIQAPIWLIYIAGIYQMVTGNRVED